MMIRLKFCLMLATASVVSMAPAMAQDATSNEAPALETEFRSPPQSARPRVWWHWMNGNISKDGIAKDLAWMKRVGIGGAQTFDANITTPQIVANRLPYMSPEWKDAFRFAASEAERLGIELAIASSPGWTETGGPWVAPADGMKKLVWSETPVTGGRRFRGRLQDPPAITGPFQGLKGDPLMGLPLNGGEMPGLPPPFFVDQFVLAVPADRAEIAEAPEIRDSAGNILLATAVADDDLETSLEVPKASTNAPVLTFSYKSPQTVRSASLFMPGAGALHFSGSVAPKLEYSTDGREWKSVADIVPKLVPTTVSFTPVTARHFRLVFNPPKSAGFTLAPPPAGVDFSAAGNMASAMAPKPLLVGYFRLSARDRIDHAEVKADFSIVADYSQIMPVVPDGKGVPLSQVINLTGRLRPDGTLDWKAPPGRWRVLRLGYSLIGKMNHPASFEATGLEVDKLDGTAVTRYLEHYLGMYKDAVGADLLGKRGVRAILNDSIEVGPSNWTPRIVERFRKLRGYDPTPWLPALTGIIVSTRSETDRFLFDYRRTLSDLMASEHYGNVARVAHQHGLIAYAEALEADRSSLGDDMAMRRYADVPMAANWFFGRSGGPSHSAVADMKGASSVAHIYGQKFVAAESMTSFLAPWAYGPADLKRVVDAEFAVGINRIVVHTSVHAPTDDKVPGLSLSVFGQHFNRHEAWAELATPWVDYIARNSLMLQQGRNVADIAYFYGEEAPLSGLYSERPIPHTPKGFGYDFINADALLEALSNDGPDLVTPGGGRYKVLYLGGSSRHMTLPALRKIALLAENGGLIIGNRPAGNPGLAGDPAEYEALLARVWPGTASTQLRSGQVIATDDLATGLVQAGLKPDFRMPGGKADSEIQFVHRKQDDGDSYFLLNRKDRAETFEAHFRITGKAPELWHPETGAIQPLSYRFEEGETIVPLTLGPEEAVHVVFHKSAKTDTLTIEQRDQVQLGALDGPWTVNFQPDRGAPAQTVLPGLVPLDQHPDPGITYFSGLATYTSSFVAPNSWKPGEPLWLDLGEAREVAEVTINGRLAGHAWKPPYRVDISAFAKRGANTLSIRVANLWVNRLIGDRQPGANKVTWTALPAYTSKAPLRRSGLIGPVRLLGERR